jgi:ferrous iron transport protein B
MMALYLLGFIVALLIAKLLDVFIKIKEKSIFLMELPVYRAPRWSNIGMTMLQKAKIFVHDAGKIIMIISVILWGLCNFGPATQRKIITDKYQQLATSNTKVDELKLKESSELLEHSYAGIVGKAIEPAIAPLGFDWKIGIALITSFAAREVFVGTMSTIYSVGTDDANPKPLLQKMSEATNANGQKVYTLASGISLLLFYVFAMQCMSTMAIVKRETGSWKYALIQFIYMEALAFIFSLIAYKILNV